MLPPIITRWCHGLVHSAARGSRRVQFKVYFFQLRAAHPLGFRGCASRVENQEPAAGDAQADPERPGRRARRPAEPPAEAIDIPQPRTLLESPTSRGPAAKRCFSSDARMSSHAQHSGGAWSHSVRRSPPPTVRARGALGSGLCYIPDFCAAVVRDRPSSTARFDTARPPTRQTK